MFSVDFLSNMLLSCLDCCIILILAAYFFRFKQCGEIMFWESGGIIGNWLFGLADLFCLGEEEFDFFFEVGNFDYVVGVVGGVEDGKFAGLDVDTVVALEYIAIDADLKGVMPEGSVGDAADWGEGGFVVSAGDYGATVFNDFVSALPVVYGE